MQRETQPSKSYRALALLAHAARPRATACDLGLVWLIAAALLEALGPLLGKHFVDNYPLPRSGRHGTWPPC